MFSLIVSDVAAPIAGAPSSAERPFDYTLPAGGADELLEFIERVRKYQPNTPLQVTEHRRKAPTALTAAAKRILSLKKDEWSNAYQTALVALLRDRAHLLAKVNPTQQASTRRTAKSVKTSFWRRIAVSCVAQRPKPAG